jgi:hypothetical protein
MQLTLATMITSWRDSSERVALWRIRSICSFRIESFSIYVSLDGMYASGW